MWLRTLVLAVFLFAYFPGGCSLPNAPSDDNAILRWEKSPLSTCGPSSFECDNSTCIPRDLVCNRRVDCDDFSDEIDCLFVCDANRKTVHKTFMCDNYSDCKDTTDEAGCSTSQESTIRTKANDSEASIRVNNAKSAIPFALLLVANDAIRRRDTPCSSNPTNCSGTLICTSTVSINNVDACMQCTCNNSYDTTAATDYTTISRNSGWRVETSTTLTTASSKLIGRNEIAGLKKCREEGLAEVRAEDEYLFMVQLGLVNTAYGSVVKDRACRALKNLSSCLDLHGEKVPDTYIWPDDCTADVSTHTTTSGVATEDSISSRLRRCTNQTNDELFLFKRLQRLNESSSAYKTTLREYCNDASVADQCTTALRNIPQPSTFSDTGYSTTTRLSPETRLKQMHQRVLDAYDRFVLRSRLH